MKCKGCTGEVEYIPLTEAVDRGGNFYAAGPALTHIPTPPCQWFTETPAVQILAYINVAEYKTRQTPLPGLAGK